MRICLVNPTYLMRRPISDMARLLVQEGYDVGICTPRSRKTKVLHHATDLNSKLHTYATVQPPTGFEWPIPLPGFLITLHSVLTKYDVIHLWTHSYISTLLFTLFAKVYRKKVIISLDTVPGRSFLFDSWIDAAYKVFNKTAGLFQLMCADYISLYSTKLLPFLEKQLHKKCVITPTGIGKVYNYKKQRETKTILFIGLVSYRKGIDRIIAIAKKMPTYKFIVAGDSPERKHWQHQSPNNMHYVGRISEIQKLLSTSTALLLPSRAEGLPGVVLEAMASGCPVITSDILCTNDIIQHNKNNGILVKQDDIQGYVQAIKRINTIDTTKAKQTIVSKFLWSKNIKTFVKLYRTCAE